MWSGNFWLVLGIIRLKWQCVMREETQKGQQTRREDAFRTCFHPRYLSSFKIWRFGKYWSFWCRMKWLHLAGNFFLKMHSCKPNHGTAFIQTSWPLSMLPSVSELLCWLRRMAKTWTNLHVHVGEMYRRELSEGTTREEQKQKSETKPLRVK